MLANKVSAPKSAPLADRLRDATGIAFLSGSLALGASEVMPKDYLCPSTPGGMCGAAFGDMGTGNSRAIVEEARAQALIDSTSTDEKPTEAR